MTGDKRKSERIPVQAHATYLKEDKNSWEECLIMDVSREGMGILLLSNGLTNAGENLMLEIMIASKTIEATGTIMWTKELQGSKVINCAAGIKFIDMDDKARKSLVDYAYSQSDRDG